MLWPFSWGKYFAASRSALVESRLTLINEIVAMQGYFPRFGLYC